MSRLGLQVSGTAAFVLALGALAGPACTCGHASSRSWRHVRDDEPLGPPASAVLREESELARSLEEQGHTVRIHVGAEPGPLDLLSAPTVWSRRIALDTVFETLVRYRGAGGVRPHFEAALAASYHISPGGQLIEIGLQPGVRFHDGGALSSVDVQFSIDAARDPRTGPGFLRRGLEAVERVELAGARGVRIYLTRPDGYVLRTLAEVPIVPQRVYQGRLGKAAPAPIGSGPFRVTSQAGGSVHLERFAGYWGPAPKVRDLAFLYQPDDAKAVSLATSGELDLVPELLAVHADQASRKEVQRSLVPISLGAAELDYVVLNLSRPPLDDVRIRRALSLLVDRAHLGGATRVAPAVGPVWPGGLGDGEAPAALTFDPTAAGRLLDEAGFVAEHGARVRAGQRLALVALSADEPSAEREAVLTGLRQAGIFVEERVGSPAVLQNRLRDHEFQIAFVRYRGQVDQDLSPLVGSGGRDNYGGLADREVDRLLAAMERVFDPALRRPLATQLGARLAELVPIIPLVRPVPDGLVARRVQGLTVEGDWLFLRDLALAGDAPSE